MKTEDELIIEESLDKYGGVENLQNGTVESIGSFVNNILANNLVECGDTEDEE